MRFFIKLFIVELKRLIKLLPRLAAGALVLCAAAAALSFGAVGLLNKTNSISRAEVMLVMPKEDNYLSIALDMLKNMESTASLCDFRQTLSQDEAVNAVKNGDACAAVIFPNNFIRDVVNGKNTPVQIVLDANSSINNVLFRDLADSGCNMLAAVQAGIYTVQRAYESQRGKSLDKNNLNEINMTYVSFVMSREKYYYDISASATGDMTPMQYYISMGIVLVLLLSGMCMGSFMLGGSKAFYEKVRFVCGGMDFAAVLAKQLCIFLFYCLLLSACLLAVRLFGMELRLDFAAMGIVLWLAAALTAFIYKAADNIAAGALLIFLFTAVAGFVGGAFLPSGLLPYILREISPYSPVNAMAMCLSSLFRQGFYVENAAALLCWTAGVQLLLLMGKREG